MNALQKEKLNNLFNKYKNDEFILTKLNNALNNLENNLHQEEQNRNNKNELALQIWNSQLDLVKIIKEKYNYSYLSSNNMFFIKGIFSSNCDYLIIKEDDIYLSISQELNKFPLLLNNKFKTISLVMKQIKEQDLFSQVPEETKISEAKTLFANHVFITENSTPSEKESILFFILIGEILLKKQSSSIFFINSSLKAVITLIYNSVFNKSGINTNLINGNFVSKYHKDHNRNNFRILFSQNNIDMEVISNYLVSNPITFLLICTYFHSKYISSDSYLDKLKSTSLSLYNQIFYLTLYNNEQIVEKFIQFCLESDTKENLPISWKNMQFIWNFYLEQHNLPNMMYSLNLKEEINKKIEYDATNDVYLNVTSKYLPKISQFLQFWEENFVIVKDPKLLLIDDEICEFDIAEIHYLFKKAGSLSKYQIKNILEHYYGDDIYFEKETITNIKSKLWDKSKELNIFYSTNCISNTNDLENKYKNYLVFFESNTRFVTYDYFKKYFQNKFS